MIDDEIPKHRKKPKYKRFGIGITWDALGRNWTYIRWYETEKARDTAMLDLPKHECIKGRHTYAKVER